MFKKIIKRFLLGFIIDVFIAYTITILNSLLFGNGNFYPATPGLLKLCKTPIGAVTLQFFLSGILGAVMGVSTFIWEIDSWSITRQTITHFFVITTAMLIIAYLCYWMPHTIKGFLLWIMMFVVLYIIIWTICYISYKYKINQINKSLAEKNE